MSVSSITFNSIYMPCSHYQCLSPAYLCASQYIVPTFCLYTMNGESAYYELRNLRARLIGLAVRFCELWLNELCRQISSSSVAE